MALASRSGRLRNRLLLLTLIAITLLSLDLRGFEAVNRAQTSVRNVLAPAHSLASTLLSPVANVWNSLFGYGELADRQAELQQELDAVRGQALQADADSLAYRQLLEALELPYAGDQRTVVARIERGPVGNFASDVVTINKGSAHSLAEGMPVVTGAGLVGRISRTDSLTSAVQLISDPDLFIGVRLVSTNNVGLGHAIAGEPDKFVVNQGPNWPSVEDFDAHPEVGSAVVTDADSRYLADIPIGVVSEVRAASDELSVEVVVTFANNVAELAFVSVLLNEPTELAPLVEAVPSTSVPLNLDPELLRPSQGSDNPTP